MTDPGASPIDRTRRGPWVIATAILTSCTALLPAQSARPVTGPSLAYPGATWETATPESQGLDGAILAAELAALPSPANQGPLMVVANGRVVHTIGDVAEPRDLFSCSKAVTAMVVGRLLEEGRIGSLDQLVPNTVPGAWSAYPGDASFRMFLTMTSDYGLPAPRSPGNRYAYNNHAIDFCGEHVSRTYYGIGPDRMHDVVQRAFLNRIGREDPIAFNGQWGGWYGGLQMSVRDLGRLGLLLLRDGHWQNDQLVARELTRGLFRHQIPARATRYQSSSPGENSMWNQQSATDQLGGGWSFGMWRVGDLRTGGTWHAAAMNGYRGKRVLLCPPGTLPDPELELMLVCLPNLRNEGPDTQVYLDAVRRAVIPPDRHHEHDPRCLTATFDDATSGRLQRRAGTVESPGRELRLRSPARLLLPGVALDDATVVIAIGAGLPAGAQVGAVLRAAAPQDGAFLATGTQTYVGLEHTTNGAVRAFVAHPRNGALTWHTGPVLARAHASDALVLRVDVDGAVVRASVDGESALGPNGYAGVPTPVDGGYLSVQTAQHTTPIDLDYVLARPSDGPIGQVAVDAAGEHTLTILAPDRLFNLPRQTLCIEYDDIVLEPALWPAVLPYVWPTVVAATPDHVVLSSRSAPVSLQAGRSLVIQIGYQREGEILR